MINEVWERKVLCTWLRKKGFSHYETTLGFIRIPASCLGWRSMYVAFKRSKTIKERSVLAKLEQEGNAVYICDRARNAADMVQDYLGDYR